MKRAKSHPAERAQHNTACTHSSPGAWVPRLVPWGNHVIGSIKVMEACSSFSYLQPLLLHVPFSSSTFPSLPLLFDDISLSLLHFVFFPVVYPLRCQPSVGLAAHGPWRGHHATVQQIIRSTLAYNSMSAARTVSSPFPTAEVKTSPASSESQQLLNQWFL